MGASERIPGEFGKKLSFYQQLFESYVSTDGVKHIGVFLLYESTSESSSMAGSYHGQGWNSSIWKRVLTKLVGSCKRLDEVLKDF